MMDDRIYQKVVRSLRYQVFIGNPERWPGKSRYAYAVSRYPNIAAEMYGSWGYPPFESAAEFAGVSREIMAAVIEDNEALEAAELRRLAYRWGRGPVGYLACPVLQVIDPATHKGKRRRVELETLVMASEGIERMRPYLIKRAVNVLDRMKAGEVLTYAEWRCAYLDIQKHAEYLSRKKQKGRSFRISKGI